MKRHDPDTNPSYSFRLLEERPFWRLWKFTGVEVEGGLRSTPHHYLVLVLTLAYYTIIARVRVLLVVGGVFLHSMQMKWSVLDPWLISSSSGHACFDVLLRWLTTNRTLSEAWLC